MLAAHDGPVLGLHPCSARTAVAWQSKLWSGVMDEAGSIPMVSGANSGLGRSAARISAVEHDQNMAFIQALRHLLLLLMGCTWQKKMFSLSNFCTFFADLPP